MDDGASPEGGGQQGKSGEEEKTQGESLISVRVRHL